MGQGAHSSPTRALALTHCNASHSEAATEALPRACRWGENDSMPKLTIRTEAGESISHDLVEETYTIGRSTDNSIRLDDTSVSGRHAELAVVAESCYLKALGSTNGTLVNGQS